MKMIWEYSFAKSFSYISKQNKTPTSVTFDWVYPWGEDEKQHVTDVNHIV